MGYATCYVKCWAQVLGLAFCRLLTGKLCQARALLVFWTRFVSLSPTQQDAAIEALA
jgi:hypothetical protein